MNIDIVNLIENNPIIKLNGNYQSKLIEKIKNKFNNYEQQLFVASFYCFLNYDYENDYVIDLDNVWKWLEFSQKDAAKRVLNKNFIIEKDYKILLHKLAEHKKCLRWQLSTRKFVCNLVAQSVRSRPSSTSAPTCCSRSSRQSPLRTTACGAPAR